MLRPLLPHITLLNPPSLKGIMPSELLPRVREVAARYMPLTIALQEVDFFCERVCYVAAESRGLVSLQAQLVRLLPPEAKAIQNKYPYRPHCTLAQVYSPSTLDKAHVRSVIKEHLSLPQQFTVDSVQYFQRIYPREYTAQSIDSVI